MASRKAKQYCAEGKYVEAYENFVNYFESLEDAYQASEPVQKAFTKLVCKIGTILEHTENIEELIKCYLQAINLFPDNYVAVNNLGGYMFRLGEVDIANRYLELAVKINPGYLPAEKNLMHLRWQQIPRWHFRMLNDKVRNEAYYKAINEVIGQGYCHITDLGSGCGLLSLYASRHPQVRVLAIEDNKLLFNMSQEILMDNNVMNVSPVNYYSTDILESPDKCNVIMTETFDVALFGERALESLFHALTILRTEENFKVIPSTAKLYVTGINSEELASKYWYIPSETLKFLQLHSLCIRQYDSETYEAEHLSDAAITYMTDTQEVFDINLADREQLYRILADTETAYYLVSLKCKKGIIHALAVWFDLNLTENITLTSNPQDPNRVKCWEQAIFYLDHPVYVNEGEILNIRVQVDDCQPKFSLEDKRVGQHKCFQVSKDMISFMNDESLVQAIVRMSEPFYEPDLVVDSNIFPLLGFILAMNIEGCRVWHTVKNNKDMEFLQHLLKINNIPQQKFAIHKSQEVFSPGPEQYFVNFCDPVKVDGSVDVLCGEDDEVDEIMVLKLPEGVVVKVQLIYSEYIEYCNKVNDDNLLGVKIAKYMNLYSGYEHPNLEKLDFIEYSTPVYFMISEDAEETEEVQVTRDGLVNGLYFWYELQYFDDYSFSTLNSSHYKKSCFFLNEPKKVKSGDICIIKMKTEGHDMKLTLE
ncbi:hypothetical protein NQ317_006072 [Molorchus minor]|uniref:Protein arginine N-methyltransferase domain-containing protein n=1 Tax=Molorchus minor TaxID=1323400 RepID=A0ABQ9K1X6_9CUCU|nr:hypothetical protein NQ317_006072 [Molorchus minor]